MSTAECVCVWEEEVSVRNMVGKADWLQTRCNLPTNGLALKRQVGMMISAGKKEYG